MESKILGLRNSVFWGCLMAVLVGRGRKWQEGYLGTDRKEIDKHG